MAASDVFTVIVSSGSLRPDSHDGIVMPHRWTDAGVVVEAEFTGAHLYQLAAAGCVLNDVHREAQRLGIPVDGVRVSASGAFDTTTWASLGVGYSVEVDSSASEDDIARLVAVVEQVAEIPKALAQPTTVTRSIGP
ncbi:MAG: OsmC family protein [Acidimicrobiales bacterium]